MLCSIGHVTLLRRYYSCPQCKAKAIPLDQWAGLGNRHVSEHLHACGKSMFGQGPVARNWGDCHRDRLLEVQGPRFIAELQQEIERSTEQNHRAAMARLKSYLNDNRDSLWYAQRLKAGLPIGSGLIEGACKNTPGARLKLNSARWRIRRAERIGALRCLDYSEQWDSFWNSRAA